MRKIIVLLSIISLILTGCSITQQQVNTYKVKRVVDGDTFVIMMAGKEEKVRLIGVDTPESVKPNTPVQDYAIEASNYTKELIDGKNVKLEFDVGERDNYRRILAYVYLEDGRMLNEILVGNGYAKVMTVPPNVKYADKFMDLERTARKEKKGLWK